MICFRLALLVLSLVFGTLSCVAVLCFRMGIEIRLSDKLAQCNTALDFRRPRHGGAHLPHNDRRPSTALAHCAVTGPDALVHSLDTVCCTARHIFLAGIHCPRNTQSTDTVRVHMCRCVVLGGNMPLAREKLHCNLHRTHLLQSEHMPSPLRVSAAGMR